MESKSLLVLYLLVCSVFLFSDVEGIRGRGGRGAWRRQRGGWNMMGRGRMFGGRMGRGRGLGLGLLGLGLGGILGLGLSRHGGIGGPGFGYHHHQPFFPHAGPGFW